jgi:hypothetical protein
MSHAAIWRVERSQTLVSGHCADSRSSTQGHACTQSRGAARAARAESGRGDKKNEQDTGVKDKSKSKDDRRTKRSLRWLRLDSTRIRPSGRLRIACDCWHARPAVRVVLSADAGVRSSATAGEGQDHSRKGHAWVVRNPILGAGTEKQHTGTLAGRLRRTART